MGKGQYHLGWTQAGEAGKKNTRCPLAHQQAFLFVMGQSQVQNWLHFLSTANQLESFRVKRDLMS